jgi:hypothetical protein
MPRTKISEFSATAADNTDIDGINLGEGMLPSDVNNSIRELMAQLKDFQTGAGGDSFNGPIGATTAAAGAFTTLSASSTVSGTGFSNYLASPPAIGGTAAAAGTFTTATATTGNITTVNATTVDTTNIEVTNIKAKDGTASATIADSTGVITIASSVLTTADINGGTIDGAAIGGASAAAGNFTTLGATGVSTFSAGTVSAPAITTTGDTNTGIFFPAADTIAFAEGGVEAMRIDSSGNLMVGTTISAGRLTVRGTSTTSSDFALVVQNSSNATLLAIRNDGAITTGLEALSPYNLTTGSAANMFVDSGGFLFRSTSSLKYKTDVKESTHGIAEVLKLRPVTYKGKNDGDTVFGGLIAEEVHEAGLTEFVQYAEDGTPDALAYGNMVSLAFKAIQELKATVDAQAARIAALENN